LVENTPLSSNKMMFDFLGLLIRRTPNKKV
jgi:hypothetical protein